MKSILTTIATVFVMTVSVQATPASFLCQTLDTKEFIDVVSVGKDGVYIQVNGGEFIEGEAEFKEPMLYVHAQISKDAEFAVIVDIREMLGVSALRIGDKKQIHEVRCKFR